MEVTAMIARIWHGVTEVSAADEYLEFLRARAIPEYRNTPGNQGAYVLRRVGPDRAHFLTISFWDSHESIRSFAGDDIERARYYPEDQDYLLEFEPNVAHYELY
jgi:heme-degrading monooxygenase HmoA